MVVLVVVRGFTVIRLAMVAVMMTGMMVLMVV